jgi:hypothetical protein
MYLFFLLVNSRARLLNLNDTNVTDSHDNKDITFNLWPAFTHDNKDITFNLWPAFTVIYYAFTLLFIW